MATPKISLANNTYRKALQGFRKKTFQDFVNTAGKRKLGLLGVVRSIEERSSEEELGNSRRGRVLDNSRRD